MKYNIGIDLGGTSVKFGIVDENYKIISHTSIPTLPMRSFEVIVSDIALTAKKFVRDANLKLDDIDYVGIGVPSTVNPTTKKMVYANNLNWRNVDIIQEFKKTFDIDVYIANDADCAAYGEVLAGSAQGVDNALMLTLGTGVGGGLIIDGKIYLGGNGFGCEFGHTVLVMDGEQCTCGRKGCLEAYASVTALIRDSKKAIEIHPDSLMNKMVDGDFDKIEGRTCFDAAEKNDVTAKKVVAQYINYLAEGIASLVNGLRPRTIILGGGVSNQKEKLLIPLIERLNDLVYGVEYIGLPEVVIAKLGNDAGIVGAAMLGKGLI